MTSRVLLAACLSFVIAASPAIAELRYTTHIETRKAQTTQPVDPMLGMIGAMLAARFPAGDMTMIVGAVGTRVEFANGLGPIPVGGVLLLRTGSTVVMNPADRTYWSAPTPRTTLPGGGVPTVNSKRTGEFAMVAGVRAERVTFDLSMNLPVPAGVQLPPGIPTTFTMDGEMWVADQFKVYSSSLNAITNTLFPGMGIGGLAPEGLIVQQVTRSPMFGGNELLFTVTKVMEEPDNAALFQIPPDYKEVPMPSGPQPRQ